MPNYLVTITAEYAEEARSPKEAIRQAMDRSDRPDKLSMQTVDDDDA